MKGSIHRLLLAALFATGCCGGTDGPGTRAVVIGIDGADWQVIDELAAEGGMPNLKALQQRGAWGRIETLRDIALSPVIWTSVATGKTATKHGVAWFLVDQEDGTRAPVRSTNRRARAIWNILAENGRRPAVLGWWATYPAEDVGGGVVVSDALGYHGFGATARGAAAGRKTHPPELLERADARMPALQQITFDFARRFLHLSAEDYRAEAFDPAWSAEPDPANPVHLFQQYAATARGYTAIAEDLLAGEDHDLFMVYFEQIDSFSHLFMKHAPPRLPWIEEAEHDRYRDVVKEWYRYQDEILGRLLATIDLETTAVFVLSDHGFKSGERRIKSERAVDVRKAHLDHETHGILIAAGPHLRRGEQVSGASVLDVTPTLLHYLGLPVGRDMDGKVLEGLFEPAFLEEHPIRYVATWEGPGKTADEAPPEPVDADEIARQERALRALGYLGGGEDESAGASTNAGASPEPGESSPEIHNNLGRSHLARGDLEAAAGEFERALALSPGNAGALLNLADIERVRGRVERAEHYVQRALAADPGSIGALGQLAQIRRDQGDLEDSIRLYREGLRLDDSQPALFIGLGDSLQRAGRLDEAEQAFESALALDPDSFVAHYNLGVVHLARGGLDAAAARFEQALELQPSHPRAAHALNNLGDLHLRRGDREAAAEHFRRAAEAGPDHLESRYNLGVLHLQAGDFAAAAAALAEAAALSPNHEAVNASLGMAYLLGGRNPEAHRSFLLVRRLYPRNWVAALGLALLHAGAKEEPEARGLLAEAIALGGEAARAEAGNYPVLEGLLPR